MFWGHQGRMQMVTAHSWHAQRCHSQVQGIGAEGSAWRSGSQPGSCGQTDRVYMHHYLATEKNETVICSIADKSGGHCVKCGDSGDKGQISYVVTYTWRQAGD